MYNSEAIKANIRIALIIGEVKNDTTTTNGDTLPNAITDIGSIHNDAEIDTDIIFVQYFNSLFLICNFISIKLFIGFDQRTIPIVAIKESNIPISPTEYGLSTVSTIPAKPSEFKGSLLRKNIGAQKVIIDITPALTTDEAKPVIDIKLNTVIKTHINIIILF